LVKNYKKYTLIETTKKRNSNPFLSHFHFNFGIKLAIIIPAGKIKKNVSEPFLTTANPATIIATNK
jgi:hypothetical protein